MPSDITIRKNHIAKNPAWKSQNWWVKNLIEFKSARRALIEGNVFENNWIDADQCGLCHFLTAADFRATYPGPSWKTSPSERTSSGTTGSGMNILGTGRLRRSTGRAVRIRDSKTISSMTWMSRQWGGNGNMFLVLVGALGRDD